MHLVHDRHEGSTVRRIALHSAERDIRQFGPGLRYRVRQMTTARDSQPSKPCTVPPLVHSRLEPPLRGLSATVLLLAILVDGEDVLDIYVRRL